MKIRQRFYTNAHSADDNALRRIMLKAIQCENEMENISRIIFLSHGMAHTGLITQQYEAFSKSWLHGNASIACKNASIQFESLTTYRSLPNEILVAISLESDEILLLEDRPEISSIIVIPWLAASIEKWTRVTNAVNIDDNKRAPSFAFPPYIVIDALEAITTSLHLSPQLPETNIHNLCYRHFKSLDKYHSLFQEDEIESYLMKHLHWTKRHADIVLALIKKINNGTPQEKLAQADSILLGPGD